MLLEVKVKRLRPSAKIPMFGSAEAAGADLYACLQDIDCPAVEIKPHETKVIPLGFATQFAPGHVALLYARGGTATKKGAAPANKVGVIDSDYRGEWMAPMHNHTNETIIIEDGERIAQMVLQEVERPTFVEVNDLSDTERGEGRFGSTGIK